MFLDTDGELSAEVSIDTGLPIKRKMQNTPMHQHIIYKKKRPVQDDEYGDYGEHTLYIHGFASNQN